MSAAERNDFFKELTAERAKELNLNGFYIFVCKSPGFLWVGVSRSLDAKLPSGFGSIVSRQMLKQFGAKKYDEGLTEALSEILQATGIEEKK
jgi:hypothetical protein